jgi:hypothetical protein
MESLKYLADIEHLTIRITMNELSNKIVDVDSSQAIVRTKAILHNSIGKFTDI